MIIEFRADKKFKCTECAAPLSNSFVQWHLASHSVDPNLFKCSRCCPRFVLELVFLTRSGAASAIDTLRDAGYDVLIADHIADPEGVETTYGEVYVPVDPAIWRDYAEYCAALTPNGNLKSPESADAIWDAVTRIVNVDGSTLSCEPFEDDHIPFGRNDHPMKPMPADIIAAIAKVKAGAWLDPERAPIYWSCDLYGPGANASQDGCGSTPREAMAMAWVLVWALDALGDPDQHYQLREVPLDVPPGWRFELKAPWQNKRGGFHYYGD